MIIKNIEISGFRNLVDLKTEFSDGINVFYGDNGSGKTNLLEAIFVLCLGRSHRSAADTVMVNDQLDTYRIVGTIDDGEIESELAVAYRKNSRKKITLDKVAIKLSELYQSFSAVAASPEDSEILAGSPSERRNFIDIYLSQYSQRYLQYLIDYQRIIAQKNAALKNNYDIGPFNDLLIETGSALMKKRFDFLNMIEAMAGEYYLKISGGSQFKIKYRPSVEIDQADPETETIADMFASTLKANHEKEKIMERSLVGPHRDDIYFEINNHPARTHGSQGEWRTAALSLKLAVYKMLCDIKESPPLLLFDEIFAELDIKRSERFIEGFGDFNQLFLTTAIDPPEFLSGKSRDFHLVDGTIEEKN